VVHKFGIVDLPLFQANYKFRQQARIRAVTSHQVTCRYCHHAQVVWEEMTAPCNSRRRSSRKLLPPLLINVLQRVKEWGENGLIFMYIV